MKYFVILLIFIGFFTPIFGHESSYFPTPEPEQDIPAYTNCGEGTTFQDGVCVVDKSQNISSNSSVKWGTRISFPHALQLDAPELSYIPPPLKQMQLGIKLAHIICDKDKFAVWNIHLKPACVYPDTESELIKRGWAKLRLMLPAGPDPIKELELTGQNEFSYRVMGNLVYGDEKYPLSDDRKREIAWEYSQQYHPEENYLEYAITSHEKYHDVGDKIQFNLLEWGNYQNCWNLKLQILDIYDHSVYEDNSVKYCLEPDGVFGTFHLYSMGNEFDEFVCKNSGYYRIVVSNGMMHPPKILENFVCMGPENEN